MALLTWIFIQVLLIDARYFLQPTCFGVGLVQSVLATMMSRSAPERT